jgi:hypothetical protein
VDAARRLSAISRGLRASSTVASAGCCVALFLGGCCAEPDSRQADSEASAAPTGAPVLAAEVWDVQWSASWYGTSIRLTAVRGPHDAPGTLRAEQLEPQGINPDILIVCVHKWTAPESESPSETSSANDAPPENQWDFPRGGQKYVQVLAGASSTLLPIQSPRAGLPIASR